MPRVFQNLYRLAHDAGRAWGNAYEDFFTEILAWWLSSSGQTARFLQGCGVPVANGLFRVESQREFPPLRGHATPSVVDMVLTSETEVVFWESKIGSGEGDHQLRRYADHLAGKDFRNARRFLVYTTRDFDPKNYDFTESGVRLLPVRWYRAAQALQNIAHTHSPDPFLQELLNFMKEHNLDTPRRFGPAHVAAMRFHRQTQSLMKEALAGKVRQKLQEILPKKNLSYCFAGMYPDYPLSLGLYPIQFELEAYFFADGTLEYPMVGVQLTIPRPYASEVKKRALSIFSKKHKRWELDPDEGRSIWAEKPLDQFLPKKDHVSEIEAFLVRLIHEVKPVVAKVRK